MDKIAFALVIAAGALGVFYVAHSALTMPDVYVSYSTNECVKVVNYATDDNYSCENLPVKFNHIWAK